MKKITILFSALALIATTLQAQTPIIFDFDTNAEINESGEAIEIIDGITLTVTDNDANNSSLGISPYGGFAGTSEKIVTSVATEVTFTFDQPVVVNSIVAIEGFSLGNYTYEFTPTGGEGNEVVTVSLVDNGITANLNWVGVTSFTVVATNDSDPVGIFGFDNLSVYPSNAPTVFDFDTNAIDSLDPSSNNHIMTETIDGITLTVTDELGISLTDYFGAGGSSGYVLLLSHHFPEFSFSEPVVVNSVLALDGFAGDVTYVFTPIGGEGNEPVVATLSGGIATVNFNWIGVTGFTVLNPAIDAYINFDNLSVQSMQSSGTLSTTTPTPRDLVKVYPNPVQSTLYIKNSTDIESVAIYSITGQQVYKGNNTSTIDVSNLSQGMYVLKLKTTQGTEVVKRIIKN